MRESNGLPKWLITGGRGPGGRKNGAVGSAVTDATVGGKIRASNWSADDLFMKFEKFSSLKDCAGSVGGGAAVREATCVGKGDGAVAAADGGFAEGASLANDLASALQAKHVLRRDMVPFLIFTLRLWS